MPKTLMFAALGLLLASGGLRAEVLQLPEPAAETTVARPAKGSPMATVLRKYGEPSARHAPVGGGSRRQPPITRWDYPAFSVFFEHEHVVDAVIPDAPAPIHHREELSAVQ